MRRDVLGVKIDDVNMDQALALVETWLQPISKAIGKKSAVKHFIVTPNPEFVVAAQRDELFRSILNDADLSIPDGIGLKFFAGFENRLAGVDFMEQMIKLSAKKGLVTGFLGGGEGVAEKCVERLRQRYQNISVGFVDAGGEVDWDGNASKQPQIPKLDMLFVGFGMVKQEKWINENLDKIPVKVAIGVGRSFDYLSGLLPRAPKVVRSLGLEWLFSLVAQPWRIKRQLRLIKFLRLLYRIGVD